MRPHAPSLDDPFLADALREPSPAEARESLTFWQARLRTLPRRRLAHRREARAMIARWEARLREAEAERWGGGLLGHAAGQFAVLRHTPPSVLARRAFGLVPRTWVIVALAATVATAALCVAVAVACFSAVT